MKQITVEEAVGTVLAHDITRIIPGKFKGVGFKKGHVVAKEDVPELLKLGKRHLYVLELDDDQIHEDEAALRIANAVCGANLEYSKPREGKSSIKSMCAGLLKVNIEGLSRINMLEDIILSTLKNGFPCEKDGVVAGTRIIPLITQKPFIEKLERIAAEHAPILSVEPFKRLRVGAVVTGSEIYKGLIKDEFDSYVGQKVIDYGCELVQKIIVPDDPEMIAGAITELRGEACDLILTTGGLSVDPDDVTRTGVARSGAETVFYGSPILPGAMFLYAMLGSVTILGLPACVYYHKRTVFDLALPRVLAGERLTGKDMAMMGHGGLCMGCETCHYPVCPFGR